MTNPTDLAALKRIVTTEPADDLATDDSLLTQVGFIVGFGLAVGLLVGTAVVAAALLVRAVL